jgi:hypothetical protein
MDKAITQPKPQQQTTPDLVRRGEQHLKLWQQARGMWKNRKPDPIKELEDMRKEMEPK